MINRDDIEGMAPGFLEWLDEIEVYSSRYERLCASFTELDAHGWKDLMMWLYAAYLVGCQEKEEGVRHD